MNRAATLYPRPHHLPHRSSLIIPMGKRAPKRFAPLDAARTQNQHGAPLLKGIIFDVDGTLWYVSSGSPNLCQFHTI